MHALAFGVYIRHLQSQAFAQAQAKTAEGKKEPPIAERTGGREKLPCLFHRDDVRQTLSPGRLDQIESHPGFAQHMGVIELEAV